MCQIVLTITLTHFCATANLEIIFEKMADARRGLYRLKTLWQDPHNWCIVSAICYNVKLLMISEELQFRNSRNHYKRIFSCLVKSWIKCNHMLGSVTVTIPTEARNHLKPIWLKEAGSKNRYIILRSNEIQEQMIKCTHCKWWTFAVSQLVSGPWWLVLHDGTINSSHYT